MTIEGRLHLPGGPEPSNGQRRRSQPWQRHSAVDLLRRRQLAIAAEQAEASEIDELVVEHWRALRDLLLRLVG